LEIQGLKLVSSEAADSNEGQDKIPTLPMLPIEKQLEDLLGRCILNPKNSIGQDKLLTEVLQNDDKVNEISTTVKDISRDPEVSTQSIALIAALSSSSCTKHCHCQCHKSIQARSPKWAKDIFGRLVFESTTTITLKRRSCNYKMCGKSGQATAQFTYYAPTWMWLRAVHAAASRQAVFGIGISVAFTFPRVTLSSKIWKYIEHGSVEKVRDMIASGSASIYDVDTDGESLLHVSFAVVLYHHTQTLSVIVCRASRETPGVQLTDSTWCEPVLLCI
jgi:hypothetical protein